MSGLQSGFSPLYPREKIVEWFEHCVQVNKDKLGKGEENFNEDEIELCHHCPYQFDSHTANCDECCPIMRERERVIE